MVKQKLQKSVAVSKAGFAFCRYSVTIILWLALIFRSIALLSLVFLILLLSALLTVRRAPMIVLYDLTFGKLYPSPKEVLDVKSMRFAHTIGAVFTAIAIVLFYAKLSLACWVLVTVLAIIKTISAVGYCPASKLYSCMRDGKCCALAKK